MIEMAQMLKNSFHLISQSENEVMIELTPRVEWDYFTGHFPGMPILPAVALLDVSQCLAEIYFLEGTSSALVKVDSLRVRSPISPGGAVLVCLRALNNSYFTMTWQEAPQGKILAEVSLTLRPLVGRG